MNFTKGFMQSNRGCYTREMMEDNVLKGRLSISHQEFLDCDIPLKDKYWFFCKKIFTKEQNQDISLLCAEIVLPIYEELYPKSKAPRECIEAIKLFRNGHISIEQLILKGKAAYFSAAYAAYSAYDAYAAYDADSSSVADAAYFSAAYAASAAVAAVADSKSEKYTKFLLENLVNFCNKL